MELYSYHIFYFPFKWEKKGSEKGLFSERFNLENIQPKPGSNWENLPMPLNDEYQAELYNEKNFFYDFVHNVLYDTGEKKNIIRHYERKEAYDTDLFYEIKVIANNKENIYRLNLKSIVLNLYSTGTGILMFYLENRKYADFNDILRINQYGRRVFPPFLSPKNGILGTKNAELADYLAIVGLNGSAARYFDDFLDFTTNSKTGKTCRLINSLIDDLSPDLEIYPVIDDRMHVVSWIGDNDLVEMVTGNTFMKEKSDDWYRFLFVDGGQSPMCQNDEMKMELLKSHTYARWQKWGSLYGISRYSMVFLSENNDDCKSIYLRIFRTIYSRMVELSLIQRASILKFSKEVTDLSNLKDANPNQLSGKISDFYKEYIRFVNQIYFREVTAQEQGIEMYNMVQDKMKIADQVKDLDNEIGELHQYAILLADKQRNESLSVLSKIGAIFIIPTFIAGFYGMNIITADPKIQCLPLTGMISMLAGVILAPTMVLLYLGSNRKKKPILYLFIAAMFILSALIVPFLKF